jgi:glycerol-3-phosphate dehydrogenase
LDVTGEECPCGARYAVGDREAGLECIRENTILKRIAPGTFECNDGLFVAVCDEDLEYSGAERGGARR